MDSFYSFLKRNKDSIVMLDLEFCNDAGDWIAFDSANNLVKHFSDTQCVKDNKPKYYNGSGPEVKKVMFCDGTLYYMTIYWDKNIDCGSNIWGAIIVRDYYYIPSKFGFGQGTIEIMLDKLKKKDVKLRFQ